MTSIPTEIGTLIVVVLKARNLPNKRHIGKQDPYCCVELNGEKRRTKAIKRGGQHPEWDEEVRFTLLEDVEDELARTANGDDTPPRPPPKDDRRSKRVMKGMKSMVITCYADDPKEPDLIGEAVVDLTEVLTKGETDEWFTLLNKDKYSGQVFLELTFWSNEKPPEKKATKKAAKPNKQYGGPGSFTPTDDRGDSPSRLPVSDNIPSSLRPSNSLAKLDLYIPPYENNSSTTERRQGSVLDQITDEFGALGMGGHRRRESFPPHHGSYTPQPPPDIGFSTINSQSSHYVNGYNSGEYSDGTSSYSYDRPVTPVGRPSYRHSSISGPLPPFQDYQSQSQPEYEASPAYIHGYPSATPSIDHRGPRSSLPPVPSGFIPVPTAPSGFMPLPSNTPAPTGFGPPMNQSGAPSGYPPPLSHTPTPSPYPPPLSQTPAPSGFMSSQPPPSAMGFQSQMHQFPPQSYQYQSYPPPPPASAPPQSFHPPGPPPSIPPPSQSAPPQQFQPPGQPPSLVSSSQSGSQQYPSYVPTTPSPPRLPVQNLQHYNSSPPLQPSQQYNSTPPVPTPQNYNPTPPVQNPGSRPLPQPGQHQQYASAASVSPVGHPVSGGGHSPTQPGSILFPNATPYNQLPNPPPSQFQHSSSSHVYESNGYLSNPPPPPPPRNPGPPPPPPPSHYRTNSNDSPQGRPGLPQPPVNYQPRHASGFQAIPPPPPPPSISHHQQYTSPQPPQPPQHQDSQVYYPGPLPQPPMQQPHGVAHWS